MDPDEQAYVRALRETGAVGVGRQRGEEPQPIGAEVLGGTPAVSGEELGVPSTWTTLAWQALNSQDEAVAHAAAQQLARLVLAGKRS